MTRPTVAAQPCACPADTWIPDGNGMWWCQECDVVFLAPKGGAR